MHMVLSSILCGAIHEDGSDTEVARLLARFTDLRPPVLVSVDVHVGQPALVSLDRVADQISKGVVKVVAKSVLRIETRLKVFAWRSVRREVSVGAQYFGDIALCSQVLNLMEEQLCCSHESLRVRVQVCCRQ